MCNVLIWEDTIASRLMEYLLQLASVLTFTLIVSTFETEASVHKRQWDGRDVGLTKYFNTEEDWGVIDIIIGPSYAGLWVCMYW